MENAEREACYNDHPAELFVDAEVQVKFSPISETQWILLCDPEVILDLAKQRQREELLELAEQMEYENSLRSCALSNLKGVLSA